MVRTRSLATGIVRSDITSSFGSFTGTVAGIPAKISIQLVNTNASCAPLVGYAIYLWLATATELRALHGAERELPPRHAGDRCERHFVVGIAV